MQPKIKALLALAIPLVMTLGLFRPDLTQAFIGCGLAVASIGGSTKIGSP